MAFRLCFFVFLNFLTFSWAAPEAPVEESLSADDDCSDAETCALNALQLRRCPFDFDHDVKDTIKTMAKEIDALNNKLVVLVAKAMRTASKDDFSHLVNATADAAVVLEGVAPRYMTLTNKTSAVLQDAGIDVYGGKAAEEQASLLRMQKFMSDHAGEVLTNIAAARTSKGDTGFATEVNTAAQEAGQWLQGVLKVAWSTATDQLPRINKFRARIGNPSEMVTQAACAADTATSIAAQTSLYAEIVQAGTDCDVSNKTLFNIEDCESSALSVQTGVSKVIMKGARMMNTCYGRDWSCAESMAAATRDLLQAYTATIVLKDSCQSSDPIALAVCEHKSGEVCGSSCALAKPQKPAPMP
ncbi:unnamed protein product [Durusdinium trenchii]|uniref:Uncharacterized protein n=1 Tax=Durusdinium trenchii TaxID=1381693 RepID=A0ABP0QM84_9DINO